MAIEQFNHIKDVLDELDTQRPARFGYTEAAVNATGEAEIAALEGLFIIEDPTQINSIPTPDLVGMDPVIINIGLRTQAATISRMALNHFLGRLGLNLLKVTEKLKLLVDEHLVNRYITPSGNVLERITVTQDADEIILIQHQSALSASAPVTASAPITLNAAVYNSTAGIMTGADKKNLDDSVTELSSNVVKLTGDQTVAGVKTFSSIPILPAEDPTDDNQAARRSFVMAQLADIPVIEQRIGFSFYTERRTGIDMDVSLGRLMRGPGNLVVGSSLIEKTTTEEITVPSDLTASKWHVVYCDTVGDITFEELSSSDYNEFPLSDLDTAAPVAGNTLARYKSGDTTKRVVALVFTLPLSDAWVSGTTYAKGDIKNYTDGNNYISKADANTGNLPTEVDSAWWEVMGDMNRVFEKKVYNLPEETFGSGALGDVSLDGTGLGATATPLYGITEDRALEILTTGDIRNHGEYHFNNLEITGTVYCGDVNGNDLAPVVIRVKGTLTIGASGQLNGTERGSDGGAGGAGGAAGSGGSAGGAGGAGGKSGRPIHIYANRIINKNSGYWLETRGGEGNSGGGTDYGGGSGYSGGRGGAQSVSYIFSGGGGGGNMSSSGIKIITNSQIDSFESGILKDVLPVNKTGGGGSGSNSGYGLGTSGGEATLYGGAGGAGGWGGGGGGGAGSRGSSGTNKKGGAGGTGGGGGGGGVISPYGSNAGGDGQAPVVSHEGLNYVIIIDKYNSRFAI